MIRGYRQRPSDSFTRYLAEINQHALLTAEEEQELARAYAGGDTRAAHRLITANLRFVVKVANEYRSYGIGVSDLVQEGNIGLMKAVQKFDPARGIRFISYAVWWIRAYVQNHILRSYSLVKLGTTQAQRKLFFSLARTKRELERLNPAHRFDADGDVVARIADKLGVKPDEVREMTQRMGGRDFSLDTPLGDDGSSTHVDFLADERAAQDHELARAEERARLQGGIGAALAQLDPRERFIVEQRVMSDTPMSLKEIGEHFGFSRERARQLELRARHKLASKLQPLAAELDWPTGTPAEVEDAAA